MKNKITLLGFYGSDEIIACSAWTSTSRNLSEEKRQRIPTLIADLWSKGHHTPFEKGVVHFLVDSDIASHIHALKHRISSANAESARYKELKDDKFYLPQDWVGIKVSNPEVRHKFQVNTWVEVLDKCSEMTNELYHESLKDVSEVLGRKRAKESSRFFKQYNSQIEMDIMFNMRSFANFQTLRNSQHAQLEIREIAQEMLILIENIEGNPFEHTLKAFKNER